MPTQNRNLLLAFAIGCFLFFAFILTHNFNSSNSIAHHDDSKSDHQSSSSKTKPAENDNDHFFNNNDDDNSPQQRQKGKSSVPQPPHPIYIKYKDPSRHKNKTLIKKGTYQDHEKILEKLLPDFHLSSDHKADADFSKLYDYFQYAYEKLKTLTDARNKQHQKANNNNNEEDEQQEVTHDKKDHHHDDTKTTRTPLEFPQPLVATYVRQLHHGIYQIKARIPRWLAVHEEDEIVDDEVTFAFKTECRPASKWHGQQGYPEVLVNWVVKTLFHDEKEDNILISKNSRVPYPIGTFTPGAVGGFIELPEKFQKEIHRDGCGYLTDDQLSQIKFFDVRRSAASTSSEFVWINNMKDNTLHGKVMSGVVLQWKPRHKDDAIPTSQFLRPWRLVMSSAASDQDEKKNKNKNKNKKKEIVEDGQQQQQQHRKVFAMKDLHSDPAGSFGSVLQMSDIFVLDYIVGNEDRLEKNWFKDEHNRFIAMDNGWALAGMNYAGSVCDLDAKNLKCPPLFRGLANKECKNDLIVNCRFRKSTIQSVRKFNAKLGAVLALSKVDPKDRDEEQRKAEEEINIVKNDILIRFLSSFYGGEIVHKTKNKKTRMWSDALARFVDSCQIEDGRFTERQMRDRHEEVVENLIRQGLFARSKRLLEHIDDHCISRFDEDQVLL